MTVREQTRAINKLASIADRKARVAERIRAELIAAESDYRAAVEGWRKAVSESGPALLGSPSGANGETDSGDREDRDEGDDEHAEAARVGDPGGG
jgi:hypothetical protein